MSHTHSKAILELGRRLVTQLDVDGDILASWMAHYIAQLIAAAANAEAGSREEAQAECAKAILELWRHRAALPDGIRPFAELGPILRALASLDPEGDAYLYHAHVLRESKAANPSDEERKWLELAVAIDSVSRDLLRVALGAAARSAAWKAAPWIKLAEDAGIVDSISEKPVVEFVIRQDQQESLINGNLKSLETVIDFARLRVEALRAELNGSEITKRPALENKSKPKRKARPKKAQG